MNTNTPTFHEKPAPPTVATTITTSGFAILIAILIVGSVVASATGIFYTAGDGPREIETVRETTVTIHGYGVYRHMSADVAVQGIGQDFVTLFLGVPALVIAYRTARRGGIKSRLLFRHLPLLRRAGHL